jgi:hypothetical protein
MKTTFVEIYGWIIIDDKAIKPIQCYYINTDHIISICWYDDDNSKIYLSNDYNFVTKGSPESVWAEIDAEVIRQIEYLHQTKNDEV